VGAGDESTTTSKRSPAGRPADGRDAAQTGAPLKIGGLLPQTGDLALANPPLAAGAALAIRDVNAAGGVLGKPVEWVDGDDGTNPAKAKETVASHVAAGVHVIIGAGASGISRAVLPDVVKAGLILFSPCNTDAGLSEIDDKGLYFRTAPSDLLQGKALADVIMRDGPQHIAIVARKDSYGEGLQGNVRAELEKAGVSAANVKLLTYDPPEDPAAALDFSAGAKQIKDFKADAVLVIGFGESANVIKALSGAGVRIHH
jgi:ABC-type branched-subunit amino acid transport system substrate-binding protein